MLLQSVRPNIVQSIRAFRPEDLQQAANAAGHHFLYTNLSGAQCKQDALDIIARDFLFPDHFGKNLDALYDSSPTWCTSRVLSRASSWCWS